MGMSNKKQTDKKLNTIKLRGFQLIPNEKGNNYSKLVFGGYSLSISQMASKDILDILADLQEAKTESEIKAIMCGNSFATMKVVEAHGRTVVESQRHYIDQKFTYADSFKSIMNMEGKSLMDCLTIFKDYTERSDFNTIESWLIQIQHFFPDFSVQQVHELAKRLVNDHEILLMNGYIYSRDAVYNLIKIWSSTNEKMYSKERINSMIRKLFQLDRVKAV